MKLDSKDEKAIFNDQQVGEASQAINSKSIYETPEKNISTHNTMATIQSPEKQPTNIADISMIDDQQVFQPRFQPKDEQKEILAQS